MITRHSPVAVGLGSMRVRVASSLINAVVPVPVVTDPGSRVVVDCKFDCSGDMVGEDVVLDSRFEDAWGKDWDEVSPEEGE